MFVSKNPLCFKEDFRFLNRDAHKFFGNFSWHCNWRVLKSIADLLMKWHATSSLPSIVSCNFTTRWSLLHSRTTRFWSHGITWNVLILWNWKLNLKQLHYFILKPFDFIKYVHFWYNYDMILEVQVHYTFFLADYTLSVILINLSR